jgi:small-conductance mechanosensitive channel
MTQHLTVTNAVMAGVSVVAGVVAYLVLRLVLLRLRQRAATTKSSGDDIIVGGLLLFLPWSALITCLWTAAAALPLSRAVDDQVRNGVIAGFVMVSTVTAARVIADSVRSFALARSGVAGSASIFVNIVRITVLTVGVLVLLQTLGIPVAPLLTALGVGGLAVALALQDTLANLFAGVHLLASKKVQCGDFVRLSTGEEGYVVDINWRNTVVRQLPDNLLIVPNAQLASAIMINFHRPQTQLSVVMDIGVSYDNDLAHVEEVTTRVGKEVMLEVPGGVPEHDPLVRFHTFGEFGIDFSVILRAHEFTDQYLIKHEFIKRLHRRYQEEGIEILSSLASALLPRKDGIVTDRSAAKGQPLDLTR